jgi:tetratricopeptide (TPR) repeat protein
VAEEALTAVLRRGDSPQAAFQLGVILFDRGDRAAALERFRQCLAAEPTDHYAAIYAVRALLELERLEEAVRALAPLLAPGGRATAEPHYLLGKLRLRQGDAAAAAASFRKALELEPRYGEALFGLGAALRKAGKEAEAREVLERFAAFHREEAKRLRRADAVSQAALRATRDAGALEEAALFFLESGDVESAEAHAWRAVCLDPTRSAARLALARALAAGGRHGAAAIQYRKLLEEDAGHAAARRELEELVAKHGRRER